jgi:mannitol/fructose-specific phosphotransferase system IIA component (Ntr-type)
MKISSLLDVQAILIDLKARDKRSAIEEMAGMLLRTGKVRDFRETVQALQDREASASTALGKGVAVPHARIESLGAPAAVLALSRKGIDFAAPDGHPVHAFFLFLSPAEATELHLQILSRAAALFSDAALIHALKRCRTPQSVLSLLLHHEQGGKESFFPLSVADIFKELGTDSSGLSEAEAAHRLTRFGPNVLREVRGRPLVLRFL